MWAFDSVLTFMWIKGTNASYLVYREGSDTMAFMLYSSQLLLNWAWTPTFFGQHNVK
jgi:hypothetical protein